MKAVAQGDFLGRSTILERFQQDEDPGKTQYVLCSKIRQAGKCKKARKGDPLARIHS